MFDGFGENLARYPRYLISIVLGVFLNTFGWIAPLLKRPSTAIAFVGFIVAFLAFVGFTLQAMLGLNPI